MPVLVTSDQAIKRDPNMVAAGVRAVVKVQRALKGDVGLATKVGQALFPPAEAELIADVVARDLPYYDPTISEVAVAGLNRFTAAISALRSGCCDGVPPPLDRLVGRMVRGADSASQVLESSSQKIDHGNGRVKCDSVISMTSRSAKSSCRDRFILH
jgi:hypothetical protein